MFDLDFETFLPIADDLFRLSVNFIVWQPTIVTWTKPDGTPVSSADKNAQRLITNVLMNAAPHIPVRGEEDSLTDGPPIAASNRMYWSVDPIDGTRFYEAMKNEWCVSVALMVDGEPFAAIILQPGRGECFVGICGQGIQWRTIEGQWRTFERKKPKSPMLMVSTSCSVFENPTYLAQARRLILRFRSIFSLPSVSSVLEIVRGHAWGWASIFCPWEHDIAGVFVLAREVRATGMCADGSGIPWNGDRITSSVVFAQTREEATLIRSAMHA